MVTKVYGNVQKEMLLEVKNLNVDYLASSGTVHAVTDVSFTLRRGEILGLAGESGSGKSTLAYAITRLLRSPAVITGGEILYYPRADLAGDTSDVSITPLLRVGKRRRAKTGSLSNAELDLLQLSERQLRSLRWNEMAIVFQSAMNALNPVMRVGEQIMDVLRTHRPGMGQDSRQQRARELFELVGIAPDRLRSYPHELSGGMRQRAVIAIALALSPEVLIMDEPTTALDVVVQREILTEIMRLREKLDFSVIFITHDLSLLLELADNVAIMYAGRIVRWHRVMTSTCTRVTPTAMGCSTRFQPCTGRATRCPAFQAHPRTCEMCLLAAHFTRAVPWRLRHAGQFCLYSNR